MKNKYKNKRLQILRMLVKMIRSGEFDNVDFDPNRLYQMQTSQRKEYQSPYERSGYNYGYMTSGEIGAGKEDAV